jgi:hypothetical protein
MVIISLFVEVLYGIGVVARYWFALNHSRARTERQ